MDRVYLLIYIRILDLVVFKIRNISISLGIPNLPLLKRGIEARPPAKRSEADGGISFIQPEFIENLLKRTFYFDVSQVRPLGHFFCAFCGKFLYWAIFTIFK